MTTAFQKRIKRRVIGRRHRFFLPVAPGFERLCRDEGRSLELSDGAAESMAVETGGVGFTGRLQDAYTCNLYLSMANRVLMRLARFTASGFGGLEKALGEVDWELFLPAGEMPRCNTTVKRCRLMHTAAIEERVASAIRRRWQLLRTAESETVTQTLYLRGEKDRFVLSLDSSGVHLYRRGVKKATGSAPLRETTAAAILKLAGYTGAEVLLDPMCGSGTFSLEAARMTRRIPAGWWREFAFFHWPAFRRGRWDHLRRQARAAMAACRVTPALFAFDRRKEACRQLESNLAGAGLTNAVRVAKSDFFDLEPGDLTDRPGILVLNPPYGIRLGSRRESGSLYYRICRKLETDFPGWRVALIAPDRTLAERTPFDKKLVPLQHGGLRLTLVLFTVQ
jgi:putative N6-adenine-specific DNA methylase